MPSRTPSSPRIIALSVLLYRWLLKLAPGKFRRDYAIPALQDFHQCCSDAYREHGSLGVLSLWPLLFGEAGSGLLVEHLSEIFGRKRPMLPTIRRSLIATFSAFVLFIIAYSALGKTADPRAPFDAVGRIHPQVGIAYTILGYSGDIALLVVVLAGLPILFTVVKHAIPYGPLSVVELFVIKPKQVLLLLGTSLLITICFLGYLLATEFIFGLPSCTSASGCVAGQPPVVLVLGFVAIIAVITLIVFVILAITASLSLAVLRSEFSEELLCFSLIPLALLALLMGMATLAATVWLISLWVVAPQFVVSGNGLGSSGTAWVVAIIAAMALSTLVAAGAFGSGMKSWRARGMREAGI